MKRLMLVWVMVLCLVMVSGIAESNEWQTEENEVWNDAGEHYIYEIEDDHAVLIRYWVEKGKPQPAVVMVPAEMNGVPLTAIARCAFDNFDGFVISSGERVTFDVEQVECIMIPEGVTELQGGAFICAHDVKRIELPSTLTVIEKGDTYTFHHVHAEISFPNGNSNYRVENGFLIDTRTDTLIYCSPSSCQLPLPRVRRIEDSALEYYSQFQTVLEFPNSVEYIGSMNAYDCVDLETIIVPGSVVELADYALKTNTASEIILNEGLRKIGAFAFAETEITEITIPSTVEWIGAFAFDATYMDFEDNLPEVNCSQETEEEYVLRCYGEDADWDCYDEEDWVEEEEAFDNRDMEAKEGSEVEPADGFERLMQEASDGTMATRLEAMGLFSVSIQFEDKASVHTILAEGLDAENQFHAVLRFTPCSIGVYIGDEFVDITQIPISYYEIYPRTSEAGFYENAQLILLSEIALATQHRHLLDSLPELTGYVGTFPKNKKYNVYRGPGQEYGRSANGKASVSTNDTIWVYGIRGEWMLISYEISGNHVRYGWIHITDLPASTVASCPELVFPGDDDYDYLYATVTNDTFLTDLDAITSTTVSQVAMGTSIHCLATRSGWVLVEMYKTDGHYWGFVDQKYIDPNHGYANYLEFIIPEDTNLQWDTKEIQEAMRAVAYYYRAHAPGFSLLSLGYAMDENQPESINWRTDIPASIKWMRLYGSVRSIAYHDFKIASEDCIAKDLVFYVWCEPNGEWIGSMGGYE